MTQNEDTVFQMQDANGNENVESGKRRWRRVTLGGIGAILVGTGAMYAAKMQSEQVASEEVTEENLQGAEALKESVTHTVKPSVTKMELPEETVQAEGVTDEMTFAEAFKAAREEVGTGGMFQWRDGIYSTFTEKEWYGLSDGDKNVYAQRVKGIMEEMDAEPVEDPLADDEIDIAVVDAEEPGEVDDEVRFLGDAPEGEELAEGTVVDVEEDITDVDLTEDMVADEMTDDMILQEFAVAQEDVDTDEATDYIQNLADEGNDDLAVSTDDPIII
ncbi:MAG: hypothetical protein IJ190_05805 [Prevotella sp.]|nr:hypothetical protein [Prevotella sp.]